MDRRPYDSRRWRAVRKRHLRAEPLCRVCKMRGELTLAVEVDHIVPIKQGGAMWSTSNHQSLCRRCHDDKSNAEKAGRDWRENILRGCDENGEPRRGW